MYLPDIDYYAPDSVEEVCQKLSEFGSRAMILAGGTDIITKMKNEVIAPEILVSINKLDELKKIEYVSGKGLVIGTRATHNELAFSEVIRDKYPSVSEAASKLAANQVRNVGTVGGNISNAVPSADLPPILIALDSTVTVVSPSGTRTCPLEEVIIAPGQCSYEQGEVMTEVVIPDHGFTGSNYIKFGLRRSGALAVVGVAASVKMDGKVIKDARIVLGAVAPKPMRAVEAEKHIIGKEVSEELLEQAGQIASGECKPISDMRASAEYRCHLVGVFTKRALTSAIENGHI